MATTFYSDAYDGGVPKSVKYAHSGVYSISASYEIAAALVVNDVIKMTPVPAGVRVKDVILAVDDLDTGSNLVLDVGDTDGTDDTNRYIDDASIGQAAGIARMANIAGMNFQFAEDGSIDVLVETAPETGAVTGTIMLTALLSADDAP